MLTWKKIKVPETPSANYIIVKNISPKTTEEKIREFYVFCGKILELELVMDEDNQKQTALIHFEAESAATTATVLSNALIDDSHIVASLYFETAGVKNENKIEYVEKNQESKAKSHIVAEILANGYVIQDQVVAKGLEYDYKYNLSTRFSGYLSALTSSVKQIDEKYRIWDKAIDIDHRFKIQEKVQTTANAALQTSTGQKVQDLANQTFAQIAAVHYEAKRIQSEKTPSVSAAPSA